jgi:spermidine synthase
VFNRFLLAVLCGGIIIILLSPFCSANAALRLIEKRESFYNTLYITEDNTERCLHFSLVLPSKQSCQNLAHPDTLVFAYNHAMLGALFIQPSPRHMLLIGLGGGSLARALQQLYPQAEIDVVELDSMVADLAKDYFSVTPNAMMRLTIADGRVFMKRALSRGRSYDIIFLDAFNKNYIPDHLMTKEFLQETKQLLAAGGVLATNTAVSDALAAVQGATYQAVFGAFYQLQPAGRVLIAPRDGLPSAQQLQNTAEKLAGRLAPFGVDSAHILGLFNSTPDWPADTHILTDTQGSATLLNNQ